MVVLPPPPSAGSEDPGAHGRNRGCKGLPQGRKVGWQRNASRMNDPPHDAAKAGLYLPSDSPRSPPPRGVLYWRPNRDSFHERKPRCVKESHTRHYHSFRRETSNQRAMIQCPNKKPAKIGGNHAFLLFSSAPRRPPAPRGFFRLIHAPIIDRRASSPNNSNNLHG